MSREKGQPKTGGRQKGTPNKTTSELRKLIFDIVTENTDTLRDDIQSLEPKERLAMVERLLPYVLSKRQENSSKMYSIDFTEEEWTEFDRC